MSNEPLNLGPSNKGQSNRMLTLRLIGDAGDDLGNDLGGNLGNAVNNGLKDGLSEKLADDLISTAYLAASTAQAPAAPQALSDAIMFAASNQALALKVVPLKTEPLHRPAALGQIAHIGMLFGRLVYISAVAIKQFFTLPTIRYALPAMAVAFVGFKVAITDVPIPRDASPIVASSVGVNPVSVNPSDTSPTGASTENVSPAKTRQDTKSVASAGPANKQAKTPIKDLAVDTARGAAPAAPVATPAAAHASAPLGRSSAVLADKKTSSETSALSEPSTSLAKITAPPAPALSPAPTLSPAPPSAPAPAPLANQVLANPTVASSSVANSSSVAVSSAASSAPPATAYAAAPAPTPAPAAISASKASARPMISDPAVTLGTETSKARRLRELIAQPTALSISPRNDALGVEKLEQSEKCRATAPDITHINALIAAGANPNYVLNGVSTLDLARRCGFIDTANAMRAK